MAMTQAEHAAEIQRLNDNMENPEIFTEVVTHLIDDYAEHLTAAQDDKNLIEKLRTDNERLLKSNGALLQRVTAGVAKTQTETAAEEEAEKTPEEIFNSLFDEKGDLK